MGIFQRLTKIRVLVTHFQASQPFFRTFSGKNDTNVLWMFNVFPFRPVEGKTSCNMLSESCYRESGLAVQACQTYFGLRLRGNGSEKSGTWHIWFLWLYLPGHPCLTGPLWTLLLIHVYLSASWKMCLKWHFTWPGRIETYWSVLLGLLFL